MQHLQAIFTFCTYGLITCVSHINTISPPRIVIQLPKPHKDLSPAFTGGRPEKQDSWSWGCARKEKKKVEVIEEELWKIIRRGLDGVRVFHTLYRHRVAPLAERTWLMWMYSGPSDPDRASPEELLDDEV